MLRITSAVASLFVLSLLAGCGGSSSGTPPPTSAQLTISPSASLTFPSTTIGQTSASQTLTLTNSGTATLTLSAGSLSGSGAADFTATTNCGTSLAASASCTFTIAFAPQSSGTLTATITLTDNASNSPQTVTLTGGGTAVPAATLTPAAGLTFPSTTIGQTTPSQPLTLTNTGTAALSIAGIALGGTNPTDFAETSTCPTTTTLAAGASCQISVTFSPAAVASYSATLTVTDNSGNTAGSTQSVPLTGSGTAVPSPQATLTPTTGLTFASTSVGNIAALQTVTLTNTGNAALSIAGIAVGGTNPTGFAQTNTCPALLPVGSSCPIPVAFAPAAAISYAATLTVTDNSGNVAGAAQSVTLSGMGTAATTAITRTLYVFPETTDKSITPLYALVNNALKSIDMTMYALEDTVFTGDLVAACKNRGVTVRVLLDASLKKSTNTPAYTLLNTSGSNCSAVFSNTAFQATHQKTITVDGTTTAILSLNLESQYYATAHDFALVENDPADITAIEDTFNEDYAAGTPYGGIQGTSDFSYQPGSGTGDELIWSPTTAQVAMLSIINSATKTLLIENEEMSASNIVSALETACGNGVTVQIAMSEDSTTPPYSSYASNWIALEEAGCGVHVYPDTTTGPYIHANAVVADYGLPTENAYMGSIKYSDTSTNSDASMTENRELGIFITDPTAVTQLNTTMSADYAGGIVFTGGTVD
jgi:phosphatidylserine/phosphatidylglycerophosphate/cardiolipin synthase-like enzyme